MKRRFASRELVAWAVLGALTALTPPAVAEAAPSELEAAWPQWRGVLGNGESLHGVPPTVWSEQQNVLFKVPIPGLGHSSPVVWGGVVFVTTAVEVGPELPVREAHSQGAHHNVSVTRNVESRVLALSLADGHLLWSRAVDKSLPHESTHQSGSWASASPVVDEDVLVASFGSRGVFGLDHDGKVLWRRDLGKLRSKHGHGEGSSPAMAEGTVVINWDHEGDSFLVALDKLTGREQWRVPREEATSWSSPAMAKVEGRWQVIVAATTRVRAYDLETGRVVWQCAGLSGNVVASPVVGGDTVFVANSYDSREMLAIRLTGARGDLTGSDAVLWTRHRDTPYVPSPVFHRGSLCFLKHYQGIVTCVEGSSGAVEFGPERLPGISNVYASLVAAGGRIYVVSREGRAAVLEKGEPWRLLGVNALDDSFSASPAIVGDTLVLRGERSLYRLGVPPVAEPSPPSRHP